MLMAIAVVVFIFFVMAAALVMLLILNRTDSSGSRKKIKQTAKETKEKPSKRTYRHISDLINIREINSGIIYANGKYLGLARIEGTNFSIILFGGEQDDGEQDAGEKVLISIQNQINYPIQYITSMIVTDTEAVAGEIRTKASATEQQQLANYMNLYASALEEMKTSRRAMAQVSWLVISDDGEKGNPIEQIREKMALLQEAFRARAGVILTPLLTNEEVIDALQQIMLPERLSRPSEMAALGGLSAVKFNIREIQNIPLPGQ
ncbi:hypothetical protein JOC37_001342 [Desulfohalotomaculum tongense]|uniref:hypothetical protein n=1 Tax=Desulforadius tongensis TaxID=1216062 RepID=UPI0019583552|nr:hypothetical protein [Desulforadius tongensis]MBM7854962.1 hypothetical protein [Desulforadius tongensis]